MQDPIIPLVIKNSDGYNPPAVAPVAVSTTYFSASKGVEIPLTEMEGHHLSNAIKKMEHDQQQGLPVRLEVLEGLRREHARRTGRKLPTPSESTPKVHITPVDVHNAPAKESDASLKSVVDDLGRILSDSNFATIAAGLQTLAERLSNGQLKLADPFEVRDFASRLNDVLAATGGSNLKTEAEDTGTPVAQQAQFDKHSPLEEIANSPKYPNFTSRLLLNSMALYGIRSLADLSQIAKVDFAAIRFATPAAFAEANQLLREHDLTWNTRSTILLLDGAINRILNPNASTIELFVSEATSRLTKAAAPLNRSDAHEVTASTLQSLDRVFSGIKRRVALAASVTGTVLLARGVTTPELDNSLVALAPGTSLAFRQQVKQYITRTTNRARTVAGDVGQAQGCRDTSDPLLVGA